MSKINTLDGILPTLPGSHLPYTQEHDLILCDRNYPFYSWLATLHQAHRNYFIRCSKASYTTARRMLKGEDDDSQVVTLRPPTINSKRLREGV